jgi:hypothetical protein
VWPLLAIPVVAGLWWWRANVRAATEDVLLVTTADGAMALLTVPSRASSVMQSFYQSVNQPYSYGGGHGTNWTWPRGGPGVRGGIGWDCSGWVLAVIRRAPSPPSWARADMGAMAMWTACGAPRNGLAGSKPGDLVWWGNGTPHHVGFLTDDGMAVSAFGAGSGTNADKPGQMVKKHKIGGVGAPVIGTSPW